MKARRQTQTAKTASRPRRTVQGYERRKAEWIARHPDATPAQYARAMRGIARKVGV